MMLVLYMFLLSFCWGYVLLPSVIGHNQKNNNFFGIGESHLYSLESTVVFNEIDKSARQVGFSIVGNVLIEAVWENAKQKVLILQLESPRLRVKSGKTVNTDQYIEHSSELEKGINKPFVIVWNGGVIEKILLGQGELPALVNIKKGIASLFQFSLNDTTREEVDSSGTCIATYTNDLQISKIVKTKTNCDSSDLKYSETLKLDDSLLNTKVRSVRKTLYEIDFKESIIKVIEATEVHKVCVAVKEDIGNIFTSKQILSHIKSLGNNANIYKTNSLEGVLDKISSQYGNLVFTEETLQTEIEDGVKSNSEKISFVKAVNDLRDNLKNEVLGSVKSAKAFIDLTKLARYVTKEDVVKVLSSKKNEPILPQLYNVLGYVQTKNTHEAVMKKLHLDNEDQTDFIERYLWALSFSQSPNVDILEDILNKYKKYVNIPEKIKETLVLTVASMAKNLRNSNNLKFYKEVEQTIINMMDYTQDEDRHLFFRALKNLQSPDTIPVLLNYIKNGTAIEGVLSWKTLNSFHKQFWNKDVLKAAEQTLFQLDRKHDSSSRTIASEILLKSQPSDALLKDLVDFVFFSNETSNEIKQYVFQSLIMYGSENQDNNKIVENIIRNNPKIWNYDGLSPRGLSTALTRNLYRNHWSNASLVSLQEIKNKIAKRGVVNIVLDKDGQSEELLSLGIFANGLGSFISSGEESEGGLEEQTMAGIELSILGTQIRPFVFFRGQGELMGHVWSGTASERTPAYQAILRLQNHREYIRIGNGFIAEIDIMGAVSFDLSGSIEISIWNRYSESLIENSAGFILMGSTSIQSSIVKSQIEYVSSMEPKLSLKIDADFSGDVKMCMQLTQPSFLYKHNIFKTERVSDSKHKLRISKYGKSDVGGVTYSLNRKNNEMCSAIFS